MTVASVLVMLMSCNPTPETDTPVEKDPSIKISPVELPVINSSGGNVNLTLTVNKDWVVTGMPGWLTVSPSSGEGSLYKQTVVLTAEENNGGFREATLSISVEGLSKDIKVSQNHIFGSDAPANAVFFESFKTSIGNFNINEVNCPESIAAVWEHSAQYKCMKATAYSNNENFASESWLISPEIDLSALPAGGFGSVHTPSP